MLDRRIISCLPTAERDPHCDKTYDCTINDRFSLQKLTAHTLPGPSCPEADKTHASPSLVSFQPGERLVPTSHTLQTPGRGGEVRLDTQTDLLVCILGPLAHRQRKARTEDPCIRSAELDLSVAGSVAGGSGDGFPAVTLVLAWGPCGAHPCPKTHLALCLSTSRAVPLPFLSSSLQLRLTLSDNWIWLGPLWSSPSPWVNCYAIWYLENPPQVSVSGTAL